ncbi:uncharacterized protein LOC123447058 isoform X1 [Hordeum vulgare subsp. vulgare]|uniref:F-box protein AT5G49610-like beta-propeller domain-containing protein n=2 Tax=Hordeum vulgare subsp. vulgare TaxID=112509 RepID=A0A8I6Y1W6_HORVV|nr:uncharacterized protein LOC123447058 isoform X1 [Hordeum vulgare subsp. vulgare]
MATTPRPPQRHPRSSPALMDDLVREIFLRVREDDPATLFRGAAGCRSWLSMLSAPEFARDYRRTCRAAAAPVLGFLHNTTNAREDRVSSHFVPTAAYRFRPRTGLGLSRWDVLDSRHGLVLFHYPKSKRNQGFVVCDLVTGQRWTFRDPEFYNMMWWHLGDHMDNRVRCSASVLCAKAQCDHLDCHGGPFRVALVGTNDANLRTHATVYSSETRQWSETISIHNPDFVNGRGNSALVGNKVYVQCVESDNIVEYNMHEQKLSLITLPFEDQEGIDSTIELMGVEDGSLLFASLLEAKLYLWTMEAGPGGAAGWARRWAIELEPSLPARVLGNMANTLAGFAEGVGVIFLSTNAGLYALELNSGEGNKVHQRWFGKVVPYTSFCTRAIGRLAGLSHALGRPTRASVLEQ